MARHWQHIALAAPGLDGAATWDLRTIVRMDHTAAQWLWNTWGRIDAARALIHEAGPHSASTLRGRIRG